MEFVAEEGIEIVQTQAFEMALTYYSVSAFQKLALLAEAEVKDVADAVQDFIGEAAPYRDRRDEFPKRDIPFFGRVSIINAIAIAASIIVARQQGIIGGVEVESVEELRSKSPILSAACDGLLLIRHALDGRRCDDETEAKETKSVAPEGS